MPAAMPLRLPVPARSDITVKKADYMPANDTIRYYIEHEAMPRALYAEGPQMITDLLVKGGTAISDYYKAAENANPDYSSPYSELDFSVSQREYAEDGLSVLVLRIGMPLAETPHLCRAVYICTGAGSGGDLYLTSEFEAAGQYYLCGWTPEHAHMFFGEAAENEYDQAAGFYLTMIKNGDLEKIQDICRRSGKHPQ